MSKQPKGVSQRFYNNTPSEVKKALCIPTRKKLFFAERVAVLRSLTATADWEALFQGWKDASV
jgi:hypothetical protein